MTEQKEWYLGLRDDKPKSMKQHNMKNYHLIPKEDGLYLADLPLKPYYEKSDYLERQEYDELYLIAIKDAVKLKDQELGVSIIKLANPTSSQITLVKNNPYKVDLSKHTISYE